MDAEKQYKEIVSNINYDSFESLMESLEKILDILESSSENNLSPEFIQDAVTKAEEIKGKAAKLLRNEREEIISTCNKLGISPSEVRMK